MRGGVPPDAETWAERRARMVGTQVAARGVRDAAVLEAMRRVPRERFVPLSVQGRAYEDGALSIGRGQTISQPFIVARMTEALHLAGWTEAHGGVSPAVLDVGTGSGYQAAVLAEMGARVTTIERDRELAERAGALLAQLGYHVHAVVGDGSDGYAPDAPYAAIVVAAAAPAAPLPLLEQLAEAGRLVVPIGPRGHQELTVLWHEGGQLRRRDLEPCVFVPLLGHHGQAEERWG